jgi:hypothetical protein
MPEFRFWKPVFWSSVTVFLYAKGAEVFVPNMALFCLEIAWMNWVLGKVIKLWYQACQET